jgi:hypothetical protein
LEIGERDQSKNHLAANVKSLNSRLPKENKPPDGGCYEARMDRKE